MKKSITLFVMACVLFVYPFLSYAENIYEEMEQNPQLAERLTLLEILKNAKPAPMPVPVKEYAPGESNSEDQRSIVGYDLQTGEKIREGATIRMDPPIDLPPDDGFIGQCPTEYPHENQGLEGVSEIEDLDGLEGITPTKPTPLSDVTSYPFNTIHKLLMRFESGGSDYYYVCSGYATGPFHILTAGHCIYNWDPNDDGNTSDRAWASEVWVWAGQGDAVDPTGDPDFPDWPYGEAKATFLRSYDGWTSYKNLDHDWGVVTLNRRDGDHTGWMGRETATTSALNFSGYPAEAPYVPPGNLLQYYGFDSGNVRGYTTYRIEMDAFTYGGHSGGPSWRYSDGSRWAQGIHSTSNRTGYAEDTRLTDGKRSDLNAYMNEDETARPPVARPDLTEYFFEGNSAKDLLTNTAGVGDTIQVIYNVCNTGFASSDNFDVKFYLSTNDYISTSDYLIGKQTHSLEAWNYLITTTTLTIPSDVPDNEYYVGWIISGGATEYSTTNNTVIIGNEKLEVVSSVDPVPDIKANGSDAPINLAPGDALSVSVQLDSGDLKGENADWWVLAELSSGVWYHYKLSGWKPGISYVKQGPLHDVAAREVLNISTLGKGAYTFYFGVDTKMNSKIDMGALHYDTVEVNIAEGKSLDN